MSTILLFTLCGINIVFIIFLVWIEKSNVDDGMLKIILNTALVLWTIVCIPLFLILYNSHGS